MQVRNQNGHIQTEAGHIFGNYANQKFTPYIHTCTYLRIVTKMIDMYVVPAVFNLRA